MRTMESEETLNESRSADDGADASRQAPLYALITERLRKAIIEGSIEEGTVILEGPVAELMRSTRTPVRQALHELESEGWVSRFNGRGYLAGPAGAEPKRITLSATMLGIDGAPVRKTLGWEAIYDEVERNVVHLSVFDAFRVNELELARHFGVGRVVARDVLLHLERLGLLGKDERQRWVVTPLDANRINHLFELRWLLEPVALRGAANHAAASDVEAMATHLRRVMKSYPKVSAAAMDKLEHDLHISLLSHCPNTDLLQSLERTRSILTLSKHVLGATAPMPKADPFMSEHLAVLTAVAEGNLGEAEAQLRTHLENSCEKVIQRVEQVRNSYTKPELSYISDR
jgi:DNA-binding GntR family transcriptional regulator